MQVYQSHLVDHQELKVWSIRRDKDFASVLQMEWVCMTPNLGRM